MYYVHILNDSKKLQCSFLTPLFLFQSVWIGKHGKVKDFAPTGNQTPVGQLMVTKFLYLLMYHRVPNAVF